MGWHPIGVRGCAFADEVEIEAEAADGDWCHCRQYAKEPVDPAYARIDRHDAPAQLEQERVRP